MQIDYDKLLTKAKEASEQEKNWHHHYIPPTCAFNSTGNHEIHLEVGNEKWFSVFDEKPLEDLELLENIFFKRI